MRFNKLDLNLLVALDALLTERSVGRAAERLHLSQSATSNALARLREYFDDQLMIQMGRVMELTPRAELLREAVRDVLVRVETTIAAQPEFDPATSDREFKILVSDYTLSTVAQPLMALAYAQSRTIRFKWLAQVEQPLRALERNEADMLIFPKSYCSPDHPIETLWHEDFVCLVCVGSSHATRSLTFDRYADAGHIIMQPSSTSQPSFDTWFLQRYGVARRIDVTTFSFASLPALLSGTERIATVHRRLALLAQRCLPVVILQPPVPMPTMEQGVQWHRYRSLDPGLIWLRKLMHQAVARMDEVSATPG